MEQTEVKEVMTLECVTDLGILEEKAVTAAQIAELLQTGGDYREALETLRRELPKVRGFGASFDAVVARVPALRPLARLTLEDDQYYYHNFSGVVCLDIMNVYSEEDRMCIRRAVRMLPMTLMAFVGSSGMSMKVLVRVRPAYPDLIQTPETLRNFIGVAYRQMRTLYGNVIPQVITQAYDVQVHDGVRMSYDPEVVYLPDAVAAVIDPEVKVRPPRLPRSEDADREVRLPVPADVEHRAYYDTLFERLMEVVSEEFRAQKRSPMKETDAYLEAVVERAAGMKVDEAEVRARMMRLFAYKEDKRIRDVVRGIYARVSPTLSRSA